MHLLHIRSGHRGTPPEITPSSRCCRRDRGEMVLTHRVKKFEFVDSVFNEPIDHCTAILEEIIRRPWKASFTAMEVSPKGLDKEFLAPTWRAGFRSFWISPESATGIGINNYRKSFTLDDLVGAAQAINRTAFAAMWCFLIGRSRRDEPDLAVIPGLHAPIPQT